LAEPPGVDGGAGSAGAGSGLHLVGMSASYILLLTAFYVDNGKHLPVWKSLPHLAYWLLPSAVGLPLVTRALIRYRGLATRRPTPT
jgi:hypothetical protein